MAQDFISALFGSAPDYSAAMSPEQTQTMKQNALAQGGIGALIALLGASGQQPRNISTGQALAGALGAGYGGYQSSFDTTLKQMLTAQQLAEYKQKQGARQKYEQAIAGATTQVPQNIPMAQGQGSQLEMLQRPEFGGDMATAETVAALRGNLPMVDQVDPTVANRAALDYLRQVEPAKFIELTTPKAQEATSDIKNYEYAVSKGDTRSFSQFTADQKAAGAMKLSTFDPTTIAKAGMDVTKQFSDLTKDSRERAARWNSVVSASKDPKNPATDATLIYSTAKILDPTGAVQQGDLKTIVGNPSIPQKFQAMAQSLSRGGSLTQDQRDDLISNAYSIIKADERNIAPIVNNYKDFAASFKVDPTKIESPYKDLQKPLTITVPVGSKRIQAKLAKDGKYYTESNGQYYEVSE